MVNVLIFVAKENRNATLYKDLNKQMVIHDLLAFKQRKIETAHKDKSGAETEINLSNTGAKEVGALFVKNMIL